MTIQMKAFCPYCKKEVEVKIQNSKEKIKCPECRKGFIPKAKLTNRE